MSKCEIIPMSDTAFISAFFSEHWGAEYIVSRGRKIDVDDLKGAQAQIEGKVVGLVTWEISGSEMQIVSLDALDARSGIGTAMLEHAIAYARVAGLKRVWTLTSNDNLDALRFYQRRGMRISAVHLDSMAKNRKLKPQIPEIGHFGIPLRDEIVLERMLT